MNETQPSVEAQIRSLKMVLAFYVCYGLFCGSFGLLVGAFSGGGVLIGAVAHLVIAFVSGVIYARIDMPTRRLHTICVVWQLLILGLAIWIISAIMRDEFVLGLILAIAMIPIPLCSSWVLLQSPVRRYFGRL